MRLPARENVSAVFDWGGCVGILVPDALPRLMADDFTKDSPMYGIGEPQSAVQE